MKKCLSNFDLKLIAICSMTLDHVGAFLSPGVLWMRIVGRIAFPLFAFLCAESFRYTRDKKKYAIRMILLGVIYSLALYFAINQTTGDIFLTLGLGFLTLWLLEEKRFVLAALFIITGTVIPVDYSWYGVCMVPIMYYFKKHQGIMTIIIFMMSLLLYVFGISSIIQVFSVFAVLFIGLYNDQSGYKGAKWLFYIYYPLHITVLIMFGFIK